jgi:cell division protease FtsH
MAGGYTLYRQQEDTTHMLKSAMIDRIITSMGGRVAEQITFGDISTGASQDISTSTDIARSMVTRYGMSDRLGTVLYGSGHSEVFLGRDYGSGKDYSEQTAAIIDEEIQRLVKESYADAKEILTEHIDKLHFVAEYLLKHETMDGDQFLAAMKDGATEEDLLAIAEEKAEKSRKDNEERAARQKAEAEEAAKRAAEEAEKANTEASNGDDTAKEDNNGF